MNLNNEQQLLPVSLHTSITPSLTPTPSAEFLRMVGSDKELNSPITPLSFDFGRRKRAKLRPDR